MNKILSNDEIKKFKEEGAVFLKNKFDIQWINKLQKGMNHKKLRLCFYELILDAFYL